MTNELFRKQSAIAIMCIITLLLGYSVPVGAAGSVTLTVGTVAASPTDTIVTIPITASEIGDIASFGIKFEYDRNMLEFAGWDSAGTPFVAIWSTLTKSTLTQVNTNGLKPAIAYMDGNGATINDNWQISGPGTIANIKFKVLPAGANTNILVAISAVNGEATVDDAASPKTVIREDGGLEIAPAAPTASNVTIDNMAPTVGNTVYGSYTYNDINGDLEGTSTFRWLRNGVAIDSATTTSYTLVAADEGKAISFEVTPVAATGTPSTGTAVASTATSLVAPKPGAAPTASGVAITGTAQVGSVLTGTYTYADADGDLEGASTFKWYRGTDEITGATNNTYTLVAADEGQTIKFEVTPVAATGTPKTGTAVASAATSAVAPAPLDPTAPTASNVTITGDPTVGQILTGSYTYADINGDPEGTSTFRWLRDGVAIDGAINTTYTLVTADEGKQIIFEVTPVSTVAPTTGTAVQSSPTAAVAALPKDFTITAAKDVTAGFIKVDATITRNPNATASSAVVVFQLMNGTTPVDIISVQKNIAATSEVITAMFPNQTSGTVTVMVLDTLTASTTQTGTFLANTQTVQ